MPTRPTPWIRDQADQIRHAPSPGTIIAGTVARGAVFLPYTITTGSLDRTTIHQHTTEIEAHSSRGTETTVHRHSATDATVRHQPATGSTVHHGQATDISAHRHTARDTPPDRLHEAGTAHAHPPLEKGEDLPPLATAPDHQVQGVLSRAGRKEDTRHHPPHLTS